MKRNHEIKIRFNEDEFETLVKKLRKTKLSRQYEMTEVVQKK